MGCRATSALLPLAALCLALSACANTAKREAGALVTAVDAYRHALGPEKAVLGKAVEAVACTDARVCAAKEACVAAIQPTVAAIALKDQVAAGVTAIERDAMAPDAPEARALPGKLDEAERLLREGREKMSECDARLTDLHVDLGV